MAILFVDSVWGWIVDDMHVFGIRCWFKGACADNGTVSGLIVCLRIGSGVQGCVWGAR